MKKVIAKTLSLIMSLSFVSAHAQDGTKITGPKAIALASALLNSGFNAEIQKDSRMRLIRQVHIVTVFGTHECDDAESNAFCGFSQVARVHSATQNGNDVAIGEVLNLNKALNVLPSEEEGAMGHHYSDYGSVSCQWKISDPEKNRVVIESAVCYSSLK